MKITDLKHGMRVRCKINGKQVDDARISIDKYGDKLVYICQGIVDGADYASEMFAYEHAWIIGDKGGFRDKLAWDDVTDFEIVEGLRAAKAGDILVGMNGCEIEVIDVLRNSIILDNSLGYGSVRTCFTFEELEELGCKIKDQEEPKTIELTLEEIAKKFDIPLEKLRIKED